MLNVLRTLFLLLAFHAAAAPFKETVRFTQPDGTTIQLNGQGDEFHAVFETPVGYTVVFVPESRAYFYARLAADGATLESSGALVGRDDPNALDLPPHLRMDSQAAATAARTRFRAWDASMGLSERWKELKAQNLQTLPGPCKPPTSTTTGVKCGLTVLVDFEDERASIPREEVIQFLNGDSYSGFGNFSSVKKYYWDNSAGALLFTNVVTVYVTISNSVHPRSYYNDVTKSCGELGNYLVRDALTVMKSLPNFNTEILPLLQQVTVNASGRAVSANFFVAGDNSGVWGYGIWPHSYNLGAYVGAQQMWPGGNSVYNYQLSPMGPGLALYAFTHENGHMLCGFPDLYDYGYDSAGGAANFCLMGWGSSETNPGQICGYLKLAAGWATATDLLSGTNFMASLPAAGSGTNRFLRLRNPAASTEYFLVENRQRTNQDGAIPGSGVAVWHIDELGNRDDQNLETNSSHANFEATLESADNRWDMQHYINEGDAEDLFYADNPAAGYANTFSDFTSPVANWWSGLRSGLELSAFSSNAMTMTLNARVLPVRITCDPRDLAVFEGETATLNFLVSAQVQVSAIQWLRDGVALSPSARISGVNTNPLVITAAEVGDTARYAAVVTHNYGMETSRVAQLTVVAGPALISTNLGGTGSTKYFTNGLDLSSSGTAISGTRDSFRFAYQPVTGDFDARVRVLGINMKGTVSRAGLMVRDQVLDTSPHVSTLASLDPMGLACYARSRLVTADITYDFLKFYADFDLLSGFQSEDRCPKLRLKREGNCFTALGSFNGSNWLFLKTVTLNLNSNAFVGLAVSAGSAASGQQATASFREYQIQTNARTALAIFTADPTAQEGTLDPAQVAVYASRNGPLTVKVRFGGEAVSGMDYLPPSAEVTIPAGTNVGLLTITAVNDALAEWPETIEVSLEEQSGFEIVNPTTAQVQILDDERTSGGLCQRFYPGIGYNTVAYLVRQTTNSNAALDLGYVTDLEAPTNHDDNYGRVLEGYLVPPTTGNYVFYLASDETSELWLGTNQTPASARLVASVAGFTRYRVYSGSGNHSAAIALQAGQPYYLKALHKEWLFDDCFSVAWQLPGGAIPTNGSSPISASYLAFSLPITNALNLAPQVAAYTALTATGSVQVTTADAWTAQSLDAWITLLDTSGAGSATIRYEIAANAGGAVRAGNIAINGLTHSVIQDAVPTLRWVAAAGGALELSVASAIPLTQVIEASSDLLNWTPMWTNSTTATFRVPDDDPLAPSQPVRFYRAAFRP
jgi:M6 family metalloprotease-like protein